MSEIRIEAPAGTTDLVTLVRDAAAARRGLRIVGAITWIDGRTPVRAELGVSTQRLSGIASYRPEDLTITCGAGTTLEELDAVTRAHGQWCPLLPWGHDWGTVGATIATASSGPFADVFGRPRNLVLGLECVDGTGRVISAGARVVKNVAGFDLTRAMTGAWGTLGIITQLHLRLRARPAVDESWVVAVPHAAPEGFLSYARGPLAPLASIRLHADQHAFGADHDAWLVRLGGNATFVSATRAALTALGRTMQLTEEFWRAIRISHAPESTTTQWRWDALSLRLRDRFDPHHILNPGLLGEPA